MKTSPEISGGLHHRNIQKKLLNLLLNLKTKTENKIFVFPNMSGLVDFILKIYNISALLCEMFLVRKNKVN